MSENLNKEITVKIKLPDKEVIEVKTSPEATFKKFLEAALSQHSDMKDYGYVKFKYKCNIWDTAEQWVGNQDQLKKKQTLVFNKRTLEEKRYSIHKAIDGSRDELETMPIGKYLFIKDNAELSLILADNDPCAINLNDLEDELIRGDKMPIDMEVEGYSKTDSSVVDNFRVCTNPNDTFEAFIRKACFLNLHELSEVSRVKFILKDENKNEGTTLERSDIKKMVGELCGRHIKSDDKGKKYCKIWIKVCSSKDKDDEYTVNLDDFRNAKKVDEKADSELINLKPIDEDLYSEQKKNDSNEKIVINNASPKKINWSRITVGIVVLFLLIVTIVLFMLCFLSSLNIPLTAPIVFAVVSFVGFVFWAAWNKIVPEDYRGGIIYKSLSENNNNFLKTKLNDRTNPQLDYQEIKDVEMDD